MKRFRLLKILASVLLGLVALVLLYFLLAFIFLLFPANSDAKKSDSSQATTTIFVISNGVHTDLVLPISHEQFDWQSVFPPTDVPAVAPLIQSGDIQYLAVGWGDRDFYLNTPSWSDLTLTTAFNAIKGGGESLVHVTYLRESQFPETTYQLSLSEAQYQQLVDYIQTQLQSSPDDGRAIHLDNSGYTRQDTFYLAQGSYNLLTTCNSWTGRALASSGVKVSRWTPLPLLVTWYLPPLSSDVVN